MNIFLSDGFWEDETPSLKIFVDADFLKIYFSEERMLGIKGVEDSLFS